MSLVLLVNNFTAKLRQSLGRIFDQTCQQMVSGLQNSKTKGGDYSHFKNYWVLVDDIPCVLDF